MSEDLKSKRTIFGNHLRFLWVIFIPILFTFLFYVPSFYTPKDTDAVKFGYQLRWVYVFFVIGLLWMSNILPIPVIGFIPLVAFPLLGTVQSKQLADIFMNNSNMVNFGTIVIVLGMDSSGLRERISARILKCSGGSLKCIFKYVFFATAWIAMWLGGAAASFLMLNVIDDVLTALHEGATIGTIGEEKRFTLGELLNEAGPDLDGKVQIQELFPELEQKEIEAGAGPQPQQNLDIFDEKTSAGAGNDDENKPAVEEVNPKKEELLQNLENEIYVMLNEFGAELLYAVAAAANIGATIWPFTSPMGCELFKLQYAKPFKGPEYGWTEATWLVYSAPLALINGTIVLSLLMWIHFSSSAAGLRNLLGFHPKRLCDINYTSETMKNIGNFFAEKQAQLKAVSFHEKGILALIVLLIVLCLTRLPVFVTGWAELIPYTKPKSKPPKKDPRIDVMDSVPVIVIVLLMCFIPKQGFGIFKGPAGPCDKPKTDGLVGWKNIQSNYPWAIMVLIGGSNCIGRFSEKTVAKAIADVVGKSVPGSDGMPFQLVIIMAVLIMASTTFISNPGTSLFIMQVWTRVKPLHPSLIFPVMSFASLCFIVPTSSVPTAIVYRYQGQKLLTAWYFLKIGIILFTCTFIPTLLYVLLWTAV